MEISKVRQMLCCRNDDPLEVLPLRRDRYRARIAKLAASASVSEQLNSSGENSSSSSVSSGSTDHDPKGSPAAPTDEFNGGTPVLDVNQGLHVRNGCQRPAAGRVRCGLLATPPGPIPMAMLVNGFGALTAGKRGAAAAAVRAKNSPLNSQQQRPQGCKLWKKKHKCMENACELAKTTTTTITATQMPSNDVKTTTTTTSTSPTTTTTTPQKQQPTTTSPTPPTTPTGASSLTTTTNDQANHFRTTTTTTTASVVITSSTSTTNIKKSSTTTTTTPTKTPTTEQPDDGAVNNNNTQVTTTTTTTTTPPPPSMPVSSSSSSMSLPATTTATPTSCAPTTTPATTSSASASVTTNTLSLPLTAAVVAAATSTGGAKNRNNSKNGFKIPSDILDDLASRFIINVPDMEQNNVIRICFQIELAHWFYLDFFCTAAGVERSAIKLHPCGIKHFALQLFKHIPFLNVHSGTVDKVLDDWKQYKLSVPTYGAILISEDLNYCLLVQSYFAKSSWGFPKGKINENEDPVHCASREVFEETGFDISDLIQPTDFIESVINYQYTRLYIVCNVPLQTSFEPRTRNEIRCCEWFRIDSLPVNKNDAISKAKLRLNANSFFMIMPFVKRLKKWVTDKQNGVVSPIIEGISPSLMHDPEQVMPQLSPPSTATAAASTEPTSTAASGGGSTQSNASDFPNASTKASSKAYHQSSQSPPHAASPVSEQGQGGFGFGNAAFGGGAGQSGFNVDSLAMLSSASSSSVPGVLRVTNTTFNHYHQQQQQQQHQVYNNYALQDAAGANNRARRQRHKSMGELDAGMVNNYNNYNNNGAKYHDNRNGSGGAVTTPAGHNTYAEARRNSTKIVAAGSNPNGHAAQQPMGHEVSPPTPVQSALNVTALQNAESTELLRKLQAAQWRATQENAQMYGGGRVRAISHSETQYVKFSANSSHQAEPTARPVHSNYRLQKQKSMIITNSNATAQKARIFTQQYCSNAVLSSSVATSGAGATTTCVREQKFASLHLAVGGGGGASSVAPASPMRVEEIEKMQRLSVLQRSNSLQMPSATVVQKQLTLQPEMPTPTVATTTTAPTATENDEFKSNSWTNFSFHKNFIANVFC